MPAFTRIAADTRTVVNMIVVNMMKSRRRGIEVVVATAAPGTDPRAGGDCRRAGRQCHPARRTGFGGGRGRAYRHARRDGPACASDWIWLSPEMPRTTAFI